MVCIFGAFGPYLGATGVRFEQIVIYICALLLLLFKRVKFTLTRSSLAIVAAWGLILLIGIANTYTGILDRQRVVPAATGLQFDIPEAMSWKSFFGGVDNLLLPMACCLIAALALRGLTADEQRKATLRLAGCVTIALALNTLLSGFLVFAPDRAFPVVQLFWPAGGESVGFVSFSQQRVSGVFNQPGEAGTAYSLALLLWSYRLRNRVGNPVIEGLLLVLLLVGGVLCASKIFFFVGIPLAVIYAARCFSGRFSRPVRSHAFRVSAVSATLVVLALVGAAVMVPSSFHFQQVQAFLSDVQNMSLLEVFSGGRFGGSSSGQSVVTFYAQLIYARSPVFGLGFGSLAAFDSAYIQIFAFSGLVGLAAYLFAIGVIAWHFIRLNKYGFLGILVCILMVAGGLGMPMLTLNRTGSLLAFTLTFLWVNAKTRERERMTSAGAK